MKFLLVVAATLAVAYAGSVDPDLKRRVEKGLVHEAIIELPQIMNQVEASPALKALSGDAKVTALISMLQGLTGAAQAPHVAAAHSMGLETEQYYASNIILVKNINSASLSALGNKLVGDFVIREQNYASVDDTINHGPAENNTQTYQWGVDNIRAPQAWARGDGAGTIAAIIDTGVNLGHVALSAGYLGNGGWLDPYTNTAGPTDVHGHGSHCAGTILGRANGVGVAPGAQWVACRGLNNQGSGTEAVLTRCAEFVLTVTPRVTVCSNSWGGGNGNAWYNTQVQAWRQAGIYPMFAMGNSGPGCRSANSPGDQAPMIGVGATTNTNNAMASFSSRGPSLSGLQKPEISAPGNQIVSCGTGANNYATMSGTSMACPHAAGAVCILKSVHPTWTIDQITRALETSATHPTLTTADRNCGLPGSGDFPNYAFGHGKIDVANAVNANP